MARAGPLFKKVSRSSEERTRTSCSRTPISSRPSPRRFSRASPTREICLCGSRLFVEKTIYEEFVDRFVEATKKLRIGDPQDAATDVGALISEPHLRKVEGYVELAREEGGAILVGGKRPGNLPERVRDGYFLEPTVIAGLDCQRRVMQEEIFGPVVTVTPFDSPEEAIAYANARAMDFRRASGPGTSRRPIGPPRRSRAGRCGSTRGYCVIFAFHSAE